MTLNVNGWSWSTKRACKNNSKIRCCRDEDDALDEFAQWLPRLHTLVVGPGLGRNSQILSVVKVLFCCRCMMCISNNWQVINWNKYLNGAFNFSFNIEYCNESQRTREATSDWRCMLNKLFYNFTKDIIVTCMHGWANNGWICIRNMDGFSIDYILI